MNGQTQILSSISQDWNTPPEFLEVVRKLGPIGFDPCPGKNDHVGAIETCRDGLIASWTDRGLVFCNPPYGREVGRWTAKAVSEAEQGAEIILLVPARTDTNWFHRDIWNQRADAICFWRGRLKFLRPDGEPAAGGTFPSAVAYYGPDKRKAEFLAVFAEHGKVLDLHRKR